MRVGGAPVVSVPGGVEGGGHRILRTSASPATSTPAAAKASRIIRPWPSRPTRPTKLVGAASRAAATAWLAPLPPGRTSRPAAASVSPCAGSRGTWITRSAFALPSTATRCAGPFPAPAAMDARAGRAGVLTTAGGWSRGGQVAPRLLYGVYYGAVYAIPSTGLST